MKKTFIIYSGHDEIIITTKKLEAEMLTLCFKGYGGNGDRDIDDYDREESVECCVSITSRLRLEW